MKTFKYILSVFILVCVSSTSKADYTELEKSQINHPYEFGIFNGIIYDFSEERYTYGLHIAFIKKFGISRKIGIGVGYETIFDDKGFNTACVLVHYMPYDYITVNIAPSITFLESEPNNSRFAIHFEIVYSIGIGMFHIGPSIGMAINPEGFHVSGGLHLAMGF